MLNEILKMKSDTSIDEVRSVVKRELESFEHWSRRLINDEMSKAYGDGFFDLKLADGNSLIKQDIIRLIDSRMKEEPKRFPRRIDAILIADIAYFMCKDEFYTKIFKGILEPSFAGKEDVQLRVSKMSSIRNKLYHGNSISIREAEQAICYSHDFIDCFNEYYRKIGKSKDYNVPQIIKAEDSYGRCKYRQGDKIGDLAEGVGGLTLRPGDVYTVWLEVDAVFPEDFYEIVWYMHDKEVGRGKSFTYHVSVKDVSRLLLLSASLITKREWHKSCGSDDWFSVFIGQVLPPVEDLY